MPNAPLPRIRLKRAYEAPADDDGARLLVERLWPRGLSRERARIDRWFKALAPSPALRRWYAHRPERWPEFRHRYGEELDAADHAEMAELIDRCRSGPVTFVFAARDRERNSALILRQHVLERLRQG